MKVVTYDIKRARRYVSCPTVADQKRSANRRYRREMKHRIHVLDLVDGDLDPNPSRMLTGWELY